MNKSIARLGGLTTASRYTPSELALPNLAHAHSMDRWAAKVNEERASRGLPVLSPDNPELGKLAAAAYRKQKAEAAHRRWAGHNKTKSHKENTR